MYEEIIHAIDPTVNPCGVEFSMRLQYGTLDHLPRSEFRKEIETAKAMEASEPGILRRLADSYGEGTHFDAVQVVVREPSRIVIPQARIARV